MNFKIVIKNNGRGNSVQLPKIKNAAITQWHKYRDQFDCNGNDFFTNDLRIAKKLRGTLNNYSKNFEADIFIKMKLGGEVQYFLINKAKGGKNARGGIRIDAGRC
tara:strand:- start:1340 stop:1654 length:315 start_codon:yes stop_codon:yes gene_type:complete